MLYYTRSRSLAPSLTRPRPPLARPSLTRPLTRPSLARPLARSLAPRSPLARSPSRSLAAREKGAWGREPGGRTTPPGGRLAPKVKGGSGGGHAPQREVLGQAPPGLNYAVNCREPWGALENSREAVGLAAGVTL